MTDSETPEVTISNVKDQANAKILSESEKVTEALSNKLLELLFGDSGVLQWAKIIEKVGLKEDFGVRNYALKGSLSSFRESLLSVAMLLHAPRFYMGAANFALNHAFTAFLPSWINLAFKETVRSNFLLVAKGNRAKIRERAKALDETLGIKLKPDDSTVNQVLERSIDSAKATLTSFNEHEMGRQWTQAQLAGVMVRTWTTLEAFAADAWISVLNARSRLLAEQAFGRLSTESQEDGLSRKSVPVWQLAKHGLSLDGKLGNVLKDKFDFSSVDGMVAAMRVIDTGFSFDENEAISPVLKRTEAVRHLLVHRAGRADETFIRRTGENIELNSLIHLADSEVDEAVVAVVKAAQLIANKLDAWLEAHPT